MSKQPNDPVLEEAPPRFAVRSKRNQRGQIGYLIVDTHDPNERPFAAVVPENKRRPKFEESRKRRADALCDEINEYDATFNEDGTPKEVTPDAQ